MYDIEQITLAKTTAEAIAALQANESAVLICGGTDVLIKVREGKLAGCALVSIHDIPQLNGVALLPDESIQIGPATSFSQLAKSSVVQKCISVLGYAASQVGGPQIRNVGTVGGNICNGVTSADTASTLLVLNAQLQLTGSNGTRLVPINEFYTGPGKTVRRHDEILTAIYIRKADYEHFGAHYFKYAQRRAMDIATLGCAVNVRLNNDNTHIEDLRLAFGVAAPTPMRCPDTERALAGLTLECALAEIGARAQSEVHPRTSWRASKEFRLGLVNELSVRVLRQAVLNAGGRA